MRFEINELVLLAIAFARHCAGMMRPSDALSVMAGEGFTAYLDLPKTFGAIENCWFQFGAEEKIKLDLNAANAIITANAEEVLPFSSTVCGIRVNKVSYASADTWKLEVENAFGDYERGELKLSVLATHKKHFNTSVQLAIGEGAISCSLSDTATKECKIIDHKRNQVWNSCNIYTTIKPNRTFDCYTKNWGSMTQSHEHIVVEAKNSSLYTTASVTEGDDSVVMRCQFKSELRGCQAESPGGKTELDLMEGLYNGRYSAYDTLYSKQRCALEIPKPLKESELGLWRLYNTEVVPPTGCLFYIGKPKAQIMAEELNTLNDIKQVHAYDTDKNIELFTCEVPFIIYDCYLRDPNNTVYFPDAIRFERTRTYGQCHFSNMPVIAGSWICGARGHDYAKEVLQNFEVIVKPKVGEVLTESLKLRRGKAVELICQSAFEEPLTHCAFIDPLGRVHLVGTAHSIKTAGHVKYYGRGLLWGDCGAQIMETNSDDYGIWKCQFVTFADKRTSIFTLRLRESVIPGSAIGLGVGITIILVLLLGLLLATVVYRRRNRTAQHNFTSSDPLEANSSNSVVMTTLGSFEQPSIGRL
uniref:Ig-like domain-containing protein n=2 Tax=Bactrocera dorsalis TaxID=27457 RepID=A0A034WTH0_BACDO